MSILPKLGTTLAEWNCVGTGLGPGVYFFDFERQGLRVTYQQPGHLPLTTEKIAGFLNGYWTQVMEVDRIIGRSSTGHVVGCWKEPSGCEGSSPKMDAQHAKAWSLEMLSRRPEARVWTWSTVPAPAFDDATNEDSIPMPGR